MFDDFEHTVNFTFAFCELFSKGDLGKLWQALLQKNIFRYFFFAAEKAHAIFVITFFMFSIFSIWSCQSTVTLKFFYIFSFCHEACEKHEIIDFQNKHKRMIPFFFRSFYVTSDVFTNWQITNANTQYQAIEHTNSLQLNHKCWANKNYTFYAANGNVSFWWKSELRFSCLMLWRKIDFCSHVGRCCDAIHCIHPAITFSVRHFVPAQTFCIAECWRRHLPNVSPCRSQIRRAFALETLEVNLELKDNCRRVKK